MDRNRIFNSKDQDDKDVVLKLNAPSQKILSKGDFIYRQFFSKSIIGGIITNAQANKIVKENGIWTDEQEKASNVIGDKIRAVEGEFKKPSLSNKRGLEICGELRKLRDELSALTALYTSITDNTAEQVAAEARTKYFASECVVYNSNGEKVFKDLDSYEDRLDETIASDAYREALIAGYERVLGMEFPSGLAAELPENRWKAERGLDKVAVKEETEAAETVEKPKKKRKTRKQSKAVSS